MKARGLAFLFVLTVGLIGFAFNEIARSVDPTPKGGRPRNVAVSADGNTVLSTSMASNFLAQITASGGLSYIDLGSPSWGVVFVDEDHAVVTHPKAAYVTVLERNGSSQAFQKRSSQPQVTVPHYCTEIIKSSTSNCVLIANRGKAPSSASESNSWRHSVIEVNWVSGSTVGSFETEREPRALVLSPDGSRLYVGTVQGALGGSGVTSDYLFSGQSSVFDGGSVVAYNMSTRAAVYRFPVGSPVRGLAVWPPPGAPSTGSDNYRIYFTHVGDGAQSEAPSAVPVSFPSGTLTPGGRAIPNVITSIEFDDGHDPVEHQNTIFRHDPDHNPGPQTTRQSDVLQAIVHEKLAIRWEEVDEEEYEWELWVTNSASGSVSRALIDATDGSIGTSGTFNLVSSGFDFPVVLSRNSSGDFTTAAAASNGSNATVLFGLISPQVHIQVDKDSLPADTLRAFSSVPMGIAFDPVNDKILVATQGDHQLVRITETGTNTFSTQHTNLMPSEVTQDILAPEERRFFTFGRGFDFREDTVVPEDRVNTLACVTCHVDGHIDGKVRFTVGEVRFHGANLKRGVLPSGDNAGPVTRPVAVPSVFDVGQTEWIFFDGLFTVRDGGDPGADPGCTSIYCVDTGFFPDTDGFTNIVASVLSPSAPSQTLSSNQLWGRYYFQKMNCTRCHGGASPSTFARFNDSGEGGEAQEDGPLPLSLAWSVSGQENRLLFDLSQSFITNENGVGVEDNLQGDDVSFRNLTDVGTRADTSMIMFYGVNTPALAGAWDNAPYFHDGRFRTLEAVLDNAWVTTSGGLSAPYYPATGNLSDPPDNAFNSTSFQIAGASQPVEINGLSPLHAFGTHAPSAPSGTQSASTFLNNLTPPSGVNPRGAVLDFLRAVSSQTNLCPPLTISNWVVDKEDDCEMVTLSWTTPIPISCKVEWGVSGGSYTNAPGSPTAEGTSHSVVLDVTPLATYQVKITLDGAASPKANMPVCRRVDVVNKTFKMLPCIDPPGAPVAQEIFTLQTNPSRAPVLMSINLPKKGDGSIKVYDISGRLVRTVVAGTMNAGPTDLMWRGDKDSGLQAPAGVYFVVFAAESIHEKRRLVLLR